jgi:imidazolonepropionase-like amidohydrolase
MPGLVDAHVHYFDAPIFGRVLIAKGVLLVRDMGMPNEYILKLRNELNRGDKLGPEMVAAGMMLDGDPPVIPPTALTIRTPEEGRSAVHQQAEAGADMIKVYSNLDKDVFLTILDEADKAGLKVVGHVPDSIYIEEAAAAGLKSSEHWFGFEKIIAELLGEPVEFKYQGMGSEIGYLMRLGEVDPGALEAVYGRLHASGLTVTPTVVTFKVWPNISTFEAGDVPGGEYLSQELLSMWKSQWAGQSEIPDPLWQNWAQMVKGLNQAGVPLMVGTDLMCPGVVPGYSVHEEMVIWQEAGIPPAEILRSATIVPAHFMELGNRLGSISAGKTASMVLVRANPLEDISNAQQIESVFLRGQYFSREELDHLLDEARNLAQQVTTP